MSSSGTGFRRTWPQRLVILCSIGVIAAAISSAWLLQDVYESLRVINRVDISTDLLITDTDPGDPVNYLLLGVDSAEGLDPNDPAAIARDPNDVLTDSIAILRVNPTTGQAWVLSLPRDLIIEVEGTERRINSLLRVEGVSGYEILVKAITDNFGITINHFMSIDFLGFREVVDRLGGIPVWFENPARDRNEKGENPSGLNIETAGCNVLDGVQALQYVRSRGYQELIDGEWDYVGNSDFGRIERQQDFLVLALEQAIERQGARNPTQVASLIRAGAESLLLDGELTVAELVDVGEAFSDFDPENLERYSLQVETDGVGDAYRGERMVPEVNDAVLDIFKGAADLRSPGEVSFDLYGPEGSEIDRIATELDNLKFNVDGTFVVGQSDVVQRENVVIYPTGQRAAAETVARYLLPIPRLVEDASADGLSVVLGTQHEQVMVLFPHEPPFMRAAVAALGDGPVPSLDGAQAIESSGSSSTEPTNSSSTSEAATTTTVTTTTTGPVDDSAVTTTTNGIIGRIPEGQSCG